MAFHVPEDETVLQKRLRLLRVDTQDWSQRFWAAHNEEFNRRRKEFVEGNQKPDKTSLTAEEMSGFYKEFLDGKWRDHIEYNKEWQRRNFSILFLSAMAKVEGIFRANKQ